MKLSFRQAIYGFTLFALGLEVFRIIRSDSLAYIFLVWNVFLAFIPFWISSYLKRRDTLQWKHLLAAGAWFLFLPNAPYILTDLFHFRQREGIALWYDLVLVASYALIGFMLFFRSLMDMLLLLRRHLSRRQMNLVLPVVFWLTAYGLYLGRYERFNSWDVVQHPFRLAKTSLCSLVHADTMAFSFLFALFLWFIYTTMLSFHRHEKS